MNDLDQELAAAFERLAGRAPHAPDLAGVVRRKARRRTATVTGLMAGSVAAAVAALVVLVNGPLDGSKGTTDVAVTVAPSCESTVTREVLPEWARTGFSEPEPVMPFVRSASGNVVAILFGDELTSPAAPNSGNKVLWVWNRLPADVTRIHAVARLEGTGPTVTEGLPTPAGPSSVNLPAPGCWRLSLTWPGGSDSIDLRVVSPGR